MEELKNFFADIRSRLNSPLIGSFVLTWFIVNWRIPIILLFYKHNEVSLDGYTSFQDVIFKNTNLTSNVLYPFAAALVYTFIFPVVRSWIKVYQTWVAIAGQDKIYDLTYSSKTYSTKINELVRSHQIEMQQYEVAKQDLSQKSAEIQNNRDDISRYREDIDRLNNEKNELTMTVATINQRNQQNAMDGKWKVTGLTIDPQVWSIESGRIFINDQHKYDIQGVLADITTNRTAFLYLEVQGSKSRQTIFFNELGAYGRKVGFAMGNSVTFESIPN